MDVLLGLDVGTTAVKGQAIDLYGSVLASARQSLALFTPAPGWVEQDPRELWQAVCTVCRAILAGLPSGAQISALSLSSQGATSIPADAEGKPTYNALSWMDNRAVEEAAAAAERLGLDEIYTITGWPLFESSPLNHAAWFHKHCPEESRRTRRLLFVNDYILHQLSGSYCMDPSNASISQLYNIARGEWDPRLLELAGIQSQQLSPVLPSGVVVGELTRQASEETGLPHGMAVINGAHDQYCAAVSVGIIHPGPVLLSCGTAWVILAIPSGLEAARRGGLAVSRHAVEGCWGGIRSLRGVGASVEWLLRQSYAEAQSSNGDRYGLLNREASLSQPGAGGLVFTPLAGGHVETEDLSNPGLVGLGLNHTRGDVARALLEGIAFELRWTLEEVRQGVEMRSLKMIGGGASSPIWPQIIADVTGLPVDLPDVSEAASLGAAILAGIGAGRFRSVEEACQAVRKQERSLQPDAGLSDLYGAAFQRYRSIWNTLHAEERNDWMAEKQRLA